MDALEIVFIGNPSHTGKPPIRTRSKGINGRTVEQFIKGITLKKRSIGWPLTVMAIAMTASTALTTGTAHASPGPLTGDTIDKAVHEVDETQDWCNGMGCAEHQHTKATLFIRYTYVEDADGNIVAKPTEAFIKGETRTWTDLKLAGFHATTQVTLGPAFHQTPQYRYGVDGQWIPSTTGSDRTDHWTDTVPLNAAMSDRANKGGLMDVNFWR